MRRYYRIAAAWATLAIGAIAATVIRARPKPPVVASSHGGVCLCSDRPACVVQGGGNLRPSRDHRNSHGSAVQAARGRGKHAMSILLVTDGASREDLAETLTLLNIDAKRLPHVIEHSIIKDLPTLWSVAHARINAVLDDWQAAP